METIHLKINAKVYDHVMWLLQQFDSNDVEIVSDKFYKDKAELDETLRLMDAGEMKYYTLDEAEQKVDEFLANKK
jgi:hypothetical protein